MISMLTRPRLDIRSRATRLAAWSATAIVAVASTSDIRTSGNGILAGAARVGEVRSVLTRPRAPAGDQEKPGRWLLLAGLGAFAVALGLYVIYTVIHPKSFTMDPVDLAVYRSGGLIVRHVRPLYDPRLAAPLYDWIGYGKLHLPFTYTPFAAIAFAVISFVPWWLSQQLSVAVDIVALLAALWFTLGGLGYRKDQTRLAVTLLGAAAVFWTEPVLRTIYLGQVNLVLMALIIWDLCQPDTRPNTGKSRWWKGFGTGIAAGIKLVPLIFIPYLLLARKFRQAAMACAGFAFTVLLGFVILPKDSTKWWFDGLFVQGGRTGFTGWAGNQSLDGLITRLAGSVNGAKPAWIAAAVLVGRGRRDLRRPARPQGLPGSRAADGRADRAARLAHQLGPPLGVDRARRAGGRALRGAGLAAERQEGRLGARDPGRGHRGLVRRLAGPAVHGQAQPRQRLARPALDPQEHQPGLLPAVRGPALVHRIPLARPGPHRGQRLRRWPGWRCSGCCWPCRCCCRSRTKEHDDEPGRSQAGLRGRLRLPAA